MKTRKYKYGLSLVEMLIVIAVIALLVTMVVGVASRIDNQAKEKSLESLFLQLEGALEEYKEFQGVFPDPNPLDPPYLTHSAALYGQLHSIPSSRKILEKISDSLIQSNPNAVGMLQINDPWGTTLDYRYTPGDNFPELVSAGPDKIFGSADDIKNR